MEQIGAGAVEVLAGDVDDLDAVYAELRGLAGVAVQMVPPQAEPGEQGSVADVLTIACTSGAVTALLSAIKALADSRGPAFRLQIRRGKDRLEISARDPEKGLAALKDLLDGS